MVISAPIVTIRPDAGSSLLPGQSAKRKPLIHPDCEIAESKSITRLAIRR
jgi:hypothetical protein